MHSQLLSSLLGRKSQQQNTEGSFCLPSCISSHPSMYALDLCDHNSKGNRFRRNDLFVLRISIHRDRKRMAKKQGQKTDAGRGGYSIFKGLL